MYQIQTWTFENRGCVTHAVGDPVKADAAIRAAFYARNTREVCVWYPNHTVTQASRKSPEAPWRCFKGRLPPGVV
jgi:hypothetical protein